ncbi:MAG: uroporphyrinogen-III C-methyltransferase [Hyphomicrobium sp.]|uniref:uroporphyrinogen-III C-methyltransferase n=1 Tax=Hyphomicrobium sp. TaxID=82 RepID=UPI0039E34AFB
MQADVTSWHRALGAVYPVFKIFEIVLRTASAPLVRLIEMASGLASQWDHEADRRAPHGRVVLVGAGPGDPELLTIKAMRAIESADVILFDALVSEEILDLAPSHAELICVGKRGGRPSCRQDDINELMVRYARAGKHVVRLKAGDPAIFGRAGEEISHLELEGLEAEIIPGITAASAMAAAFGISLTHRSHAKSVRFVTGHSKNGGLPEDLDWQAIADPSATTIFYMGAPFAGEIAARLIALGMPDNTPVGIASSLSRDNQKVVHCVLGQLEKLVASFDRTEPLILGIGSVYARANALATPVQPHGKCAVT